MAVMPPHPSETRVQNCRLQGKVLTPHQRSAVITLQPLETLSLPLGGHCAPLGLSHQHMRSESRHTTLPRSVGILHFIMAERR